MKTTSLVFSALLVVSSIAAAQEPTQEQKEAKICGDSRDIRVIDAQKYTRAWVSRVTAIQSACRLAETKTGDYRVSGDRIQAEKQWRAVCPKGFPAGENEESATSVLAVMQPGVIVCIAKTADDVECQSPTDDSASKQLDTWCKPYDLKAGVDLFPAINVMADLNKLLSIKTSKEAQRMSRTPAK